MSPEMLTAIVNWLPMVLFIGVFLYFVKRAGQQGMQAKAPSGLSMIELYEQQVTEARRMNDKLERIAAALEKKTQQS